MNIGVNRFGTRSAAETAVTVTVGVGDFAVDDRPEAKLVTHALGSCIGLTIYDPVAKVSGMLHFMLPSAKGREQKASEQPAMFGSSGIPLLFRSAYELGAVKKRLIVCAAGGAEIVQGMDQFRVGDKNRTMLRKLLWKNSLALSSEDTGGTCSRTMTLHGCDGAVSVRRPDGTGALWPKDSSRDTERRSA